MNWNKLIYVLIIVLLYVPMVFLGANVFFPKFTGEESYYNYGTDCYGKYPLLADKVDSEEYKAIVDQQQNCMKEEQEKQKKFNDEKTAYDSKKYMFIVLFNLFVLVMALVLSMLHDSVVLGLFLGSTIATFASTIAYFETKSKIGFIVLVLIFFITIYIINKKKESFVDWGSKK
jgi:cation transport ATPase